MNTKAMYKLTYGLFVLTAREGDKDNGCIINTAIQAASMPNQISICLNKADYTHDMILHTKEFTISVISKNAGFDLIKHFGFQSGRDVDKFKDFNSCKRGSNGIMYITEGTNAFISVKVEKTEDIGSHTMFIGEITDMEVLNEIPSATYEYYLNSIKPKPEAVEKNIPSRENAVSNNSDKMEEQKMKKWVCPVCGYVHTGDQPPAECPVCHVKGDKFKEAPADAKLAAEHEYGVYAKTVKNNPDVSDEDKKYIFEQLMANFKGECSEVGMYLCMARIAHREGYPEVGLYWEKAAYEEAEHAAKFAELLGEDLEPNMKATTKDNLAWRVDCEFGATQGKYDLALCAKKNNLDAIHDTVHEMARDEARHGNALKGLLERYFK